MIGRERIHCEACRLAHSMGVVLGLGPCVTDRLSAFFVAGERLVVSMEVVRVVLSYSRGCAGNSQFAVADSGAGGNCG